MNKSLYININGKTVSASEPVLFADNHSYRFADGLFETMKWLNGRVQLVDFHFERLETGLQVLKIINPRSFTQKNIEEEIKQLCRKNNCENLARVRLSVSRGHGGLFDGDDKFQYLLECRPLSPENNLLNENGLVIGLYQEAAKSCTVFSNLKSADFLIYVMAARYAKENKWNDCLLLNQYGRICDATISNVFWIKEGILFTPPLTEGGIAGVMRKYLLENEDALGFQITEKILTADELEKADEVFLTNAIKTIRWVSQFRNKKYSCGLSQKLFQKLMNTFSV